MAKISFKHKGLKSFYDTGSTKGIQSIHEAKLSIILDIFDNMTCLKDLSAPVYKLHPLKGDLQGHWAITVQANWRITFKYDGIANELYIVDYQDYH